MARLTAWRGMSGPPDPEEPDEFGQIAALYAPLTRAEPAALGLLDDVAVIPSRPGFDLVVTKDALVEGVHFPSGEDPGLIARKALRTNLSDLAAKAAEPWGYFLAVSWPAGWRYDSRRAFAAGLELDGEIFGLCLLGGDTTSTSGPLTISVTMLGWTPAGRAILRRGAQPGDGVFVTGTIGDGWLGLQAVLGVHKADVEALSLRYRLPQPRTEFRETLRAHAHAAADVSDGLVADAAHIARASGVRMRIDLEAVPLSQGARRWVGEGPGRAERLVRLVTGGDDYEVLFAAPLDEAAAIGLSPIGLVLEGSGVEVRLEGAPVQIERAGYTHS